MGNLKPREKLLFGITVVAMLFFAMWQFGLGDAFDSLGAGNTQIAAAEKRYTENLESLEEIYIVEREYRRVGQSPTPPDGQNLNPANAFNLEVNNIAKEAGVENFGIRARRDEIREVEDYELLSVSLTFTANHATTIKLLKAYEDAGVIFRELNMRSILDQDRVDTTLVVARITETQRRPQPPTRR